MILVVAQVIDGVRLVILSESGALPVLGILLRREDPTPPSVLPLPVVVEYQPIAIFIIVVVQVGPLVGTRLQLLFLLLV